MSGFGLEVRVNCHIEDIGEGNWDALSGARPFNGFRWYRYGERAMPDCPPFYVSVLSRGQTVGRASFWLVRNEPLPVSSRLLRSGLQRFLSLRPLLICRSPLADASGLIIPPGELSSAVFEQILSAAEEYGRSVKASFLVFDYLEPDQASMPEWQDRLIRIQMAEPGTGLPITWSSFEAYLKGLSKAAWKDYRRHLNQARRHDLVVTTSRDAKIDIDHALPLIRNVEARHGAAPKPWARNMLENLAGIDATWIQVSLKGRMVGCGLMLADGDARLATLLGLDYSVPYVYFQIMYAAISESIVQGARLLRAGSGAYEFKQRLGFVTETNNHLCFAGQTRLFSRLGQLASARS